MPKRISRRRLLVYAASAGAAAAAAGMAVPFVRRKRRKTKVLFLLSDTLRADFLGCYGYKSLVDGRTASLSPNIDRLADGGILFQNCIAPSSWTPTSVASIETGRLPMLNSTHHSFEYVGDADRTLAERLREQGLRACQIQANPWLFDGIFQRGFDANLNLEYGGRYAVYGECATANDVAAKLGTVLRDGYDFVYVHFMDNHCPYRVTGPERRSLGLAEYKDNISVIATLQAELDSNRAALGDPAFLKNVAATRRTYEGSILWLDKNVGGIIDGLKGALDDDALVIFTSDHGEEFLEHKDLGHSRSLYREAVRVPLIIHTTKGQGAGARPGGRVSSVDIFPTIFEFLGIEPPDSDGRGLWRALKTDEDRECYSCLDWWPEERKRALYCNVAKGGAKTILTVTAGGARSTEVYDLKKDPFESRDLSGTADGAILADEGAKKIDGARARVASRKSSLGGRQVIPESRREQFKAIGYLN